MADDASFADALRIDPRTALAGFDLSAPDLRRLESFLTRPLDLAQILGTAADAPGHDPVEDGRA